MPSKGDVLVRLALACWIIGRLPEDMPVPEISTDPDGEVALEWWKEKGFTVSASLGDSVTWAALIGDATLHGMGTDGLMDALRRLYPDA